MILNKPYTNRQYADLAVFCNENGNLYKAIKEVERKYWKREETEQPWTQPVLSANGTIGGDSFACAASSIHTSYYDAWKAFDKVTSVMDSSWWCRQNQQNNSWLEWYNPNPLKITTIVFTTGDAEYGGICTAKNYKIQASIDNLTWIGIKTGVTSSNKPTTITENITINQAFKYWRIFVVDVWNNDNTVVIDDVLITAVTVQETITPGTAEDYDFYTDETVYKGVNL